MRSLFALSTHSRDSCGGGPCFSPLGGKVLVTPSRQGALPRVSGVLIGQRARQRPGLLDHSACRAGDRRDFHSSGHVPRSGAAGEGTHSIHKGYQSSHRRRQLPTPHPPSPNRTPHRGLTSPTVGSITPPPERSGWGRSTSTLGSSCAALRPLYNPSACASPASTLRVTLVGGGRECEQTDDLGRRR